MAGGSGLSSRVLNMKFMKEADKRKEDQEKEEVLKKHLDASQWSLSSSKSVINRMKHQKKRIRKVGYSTVTSSLYSSGEANIADGKSEQAGDQLPVGRREFGTKTTTEEESDKTTDGKGKSKSNTIEDDENGIVYQEDSDEEEEEATKTKSGKSKQQAGSLIELWAANRSQKKRPVNDDSNDSSNKKSKKNKKDNSSTK